MNRTWFWLLAALALVSVPAGAYSERGGLAVTLQRHQRYVGPPVKSEAEARKVYMGLVERGVITNDLMALTDHNLNGQDAATNAFYRDLWVKMVLAAPYAEHIHYRARGTGGHLIFREVTPQGDLPLVMYGISWDGGVSTGMVSAAQECEGDALSVNLVTQVQPDASKPAEMRAVRLLTFYDVGGDPEKSGCWNSAIALPKPIPAPPVKPGPKPKPEVKVDIETHIENNVSVEVAIIDNRHEDVRLELPVPKPQPVEPKTVYVDRWHECPAPAAPPIQRRELRQSVLDDTRQQGGGPGQVQTGPDVVKRGDTWSATAGLIWWKQEAAKATPAPTGSNPCPPPVTPPNPTTLPPGTPTGGGGTTPPTDTTLPPDSGGNTHTDGPGSTVNVPGESNPADFPPGTVVIPVPSPGSAAAQAASQLPG